MRPLPEVSRRVLPPCLVVERTCVWLRTRTSAETMSGSEQPAKHSFMRRSAVSCPAGWREADFSPSGKSEYGAGNQVCSSPGRARLGQSHGRRWTPRYASSARLQVALRWGSGSLVTLLRTWRIRSSLAPGAPGENIPEGIMHRRNSQGSACGIDLNLEELTDKVEYDACAYAFRSPTCKSTFEQDPVRYLAR